MHHVYKIIGITAVILKSLMVYKIFNGHKLFE